MRCSASDKHCRTQPQTGSTRHGNWAEYRPEHGHHLLSERWSLHGTQHVHPTTSRSSDRRLDAPPPNDEDSIRPVQVLLCHRRFDADWKARSSRPARIRSSSAIAPAANRSPLSISMIAATVHAA